MLVFHLALRKFGNTNMSWHLAVSLFLFLFLFLSYFLQFCFLNLFYGYTWHIALL